MAIVDEFKVPNKKPLPKKMQDDPLASPSLSMVVGPTGVGKSVCTFNILMALQNRHKIDSALFVTGNNKDPLLQSLEMPITTLPTDLSDYLTKVRQAKDGTNHVLVLDDIQGSPDFNIFSNRSDFVKFMLSHRHFGEDPKKPDQSGTWVIATAQTLKGSFSTAIRNQVKNFFLYPPRNPNEIKHYMEIAQDPTAMKNAMAIAKSRGKHNFVFLNKHDPEKDRYYLGFNEELVDLNV